MNYVFYVSVNCHLEVVEYIYETKGINEHNPILIVSYSGQLIVVKNLFETCNAKITKDFTIITKAELIKKYQQ